MKPTNTHQIGLHMGVGGETQLWCACLWQLYILCGPCWPRVSIRVIYFKCTLSNKKTCIPSPPLLHTALPHRQIFEHSLADASPKANPLAATDPCCMTHVLTHELEFTTRCCIIGYDTCGHEQRHTNAGTLKHSHLFYYGYTTRVDNQDQIINQTIGSREVHHSAGRYLVQGRRVHPKPNTGKRLQNSIPLVAI